MPPGQKASPDAGERLISDTMNANPKRASIDTAAPIKLTPRQELFAQAVAAGKPASNAYLDAYGGTVKAAEAHSSRLVRVGRVDRRIAQIMADNAAAQSISVQFLTKMMLKTYDLAMVEKQASAAAQAVMGIGKLHGLLVDKVQTEMFLRKPVADPESPDDMSPEEWLKGFAKPTLVLTAEPTSTSVKTPASAATPAQAPVQVPVEAKVKAPSVATSAPAPEPEQPLEPESKIEQPLEPESKIEPEEPEPEPEPQLEEPQATPRTPRARAMPEPEEPGVLSLSPEPSSEGSYASLFGMAEPD